MIEKINYEQFGQFLTELRKEKDLTQKQLAERLYVSDKAVSKWERGLSLPDISLLLPLAQIFQVTTTELLSGKRMELDTQFSVKEVESLMGKTIVLSKEEKERRGKAGQTRKVIFFVCVFLAALELLAFVVMGYSADSLLKNLGTVELLLLIFGTYFTFFAKDALPVYYDENKIGFYHDGVFRMNLPGVRLNNSNWRPIRNAIQISVMSAFVIFPLLYLVFSCWAPLLWVRGSTILTLICLLGIFVPGYLVGKKYE